MFYLSGGLTIQVGVRERLLRSGQFKLAQANIAFSTAFKHIEIDRKRDEIVIVLAISGKLTT